MTKKIAYIAVATAFIALITLFPSIPIGAGGYVHLGDTVILVAASLISYYAVPAAAIGAALADILGGYAHYAPVTTLIKAAVAFLCVLILRKSSKPSMLNIILAVTLSESAMVAGYFLYELIIFKATYALTNLPFNLIQAAVSVVLSSIVIKFLKNKAIL